MSGLESAMACELHHFIFTVGTFFISLGKQKQYVEKAIILFFAVLVSTGTGLYAEYYMIRNTEGCSECFFRLRKNRFNNYFLFALSTPFAPEIGGAPKCAKKRTLEQAVLLFQ